MKNIFGDNSMAYFVHSSLQDEFYYAITIQAINKTHSIVQLMAVVILVNFALVPYALFYDYPSLVLILFLVNAELSKKPMMVWTQRLMNGLILCSLFVGDNIAYRYWIVVLLLFFAGICKIVAAGRKIAV